MQAALVDIPKTKKEYSGTAGRILKYLSAGCTEMQAATACGVDPSLVSQLKQETEFCEQVAEALRKSVVDAKEVDDNYVEIEKMASKKLRELMHYMQSPDQLLRVAKFANEAKKKLTPVGQMNGEHVSDIAPVRLALPTMLVAHIVVNPNQEVVQVGEVALTTLNSKSMESVVKKYRDSITIESKPIQEKQSNVQDKWSDL
jgi:hypothetical protein